MNRGIDVDRFSSDLVDAATQQKLLQEIAYARRLGIASFPSLALIDASNRVTHIGLDYTDAKTMQAQVEALIG